MIRIEKVSCGRMDHGGCGLLVHVRDGRIVKIQGDPESHTKGYICAKGRAQIERLYHPDRLKYPLKRVGDKGENRWKRISWDEALETIVEKLLELKDLSKPESALFMQGTPKGLENLLLYRFARSFGSPNVSATGDVCFAPRLGASLITNGFYPHPDLQHPPEIIIAWGSNHLSTSADGVLAPEVRMALKGGSRVILIDPVKRDLASTSDMWIQVKPGADGLLALGMIKVIIEEELYDKEFVETWTTGFNELKAHISSYSLRDIEEKTWVPIDDLKRTARRYAEAKSACILWGNALDHTINSVQTVRALLILMALSGNLDRPGGNIQAASPKVLRSSDFMLAKKYQAIKDKMIGSDFKLASMLGFVPRQMAIRAVLSEDPYKVNFIYIHGTNPMVTCPNTKNTLEAFKKVDFLVVAELFMTPTAQMADIVLPVAAHFEFDDLGFYGLPYGRILARPKIVDPPGECRSDVKILNDLAMRLGLKDPFWNNEKECINYILKPSGMTFDALRKEGGELEGEKKYEKYRERGFRTASRKFELFSSWMKKNGYAPLPVFSKLENEVDVVGDLIFTSAKSPVFFHSMNRNITSLRVKHESPIVRIHPQVARVAQISEGDWAWIENGRGKAKFKVKLDSEIHPKIVVGEHGWWFPEKGPFDLYGWEESNINVLTEGSPPYEPSIGGVNLRGFGCKIRKVSSEKD